MQSKHTRHRDAHAQRHTWTLICIHMMHECRWHQAGRTYCVSYIKPGLYPVTMSDNDHPRPAVISPALRSSPSPSSTPPPPNPATLNPHTPQPPSLVRSDSGCYDPSGWLISILINVSHLLPFTTPVILIINLMLKTKQHLHLTTALISFWCFEHRAMLGVKTKKIWRRGNHFEGRMR